MDTHTVRPEHVWHPPHPPTPPPPSPPNKRQVSDLTDLHSHPPHLSSHHPRKRSHPPIVPPSDHPAAHPDDVSQSQLTSSPPNHRSTHRPAHPPKKHKPDCSPSFTPTPTLFTLHDSSDDEDDYSHYRRTLLRHKTSAEMRPPSPEPPVRLHVSKKGRATRHASSNANNRKRFHSLIDIPFSDPKYHKLVPTLRLTSHQIAYDFACIYGSHLAKTSSSCAPHSVPGPAVPDRKRPRSAETSNPHHDSAAHPNLYQFHSTAPAHLPDSPTAVDAPDTARTTRSARRANASATPPASAAHSKDRPLSAPVRKTKLHNSNAIDVTQKGQFMRHSEKKGWVVCRRCSTSVWPPNCAKHVAHCARK